MEGRKGKLLLLVVAAVVGSSGEVFFNVFHVFLLLLWCSLEVVALRLRCKVHRRWFPCSDVPCPERSCMRYENDRHIGNPCRMTTQREPDGASSPSNARCPSLRHFTPLEQTYEKAIKDMPWKGIVHNNATVANLIRKAEIRVLPAVIVVDDKVRTRVQLFRVLLIFSLALSMVLSCLMLLRLVSWACV